MFGRLTLDALPHDPIVIAATVFMVCVGAATLCFVTYFRAWGYIWHEWLTSVDHKKIAIMYGITAFVMLVRGLVDASMVRAQQAIAVGNSAGYLPPDHFDQLFTAHGVIMIFFVAMPLMFAIINAMLPLQLGTRDVAFPVLNSISLWLFIAGAVLMNISLTIGEFAAAGWLAYPPLSGLAYSPGVGIDYYIWVIQISGVGSLLSAVNFVATIIKERAPGMTLMNMPIFVWTVFASMTLIIISFPVLTATLAMLSLDRFLGMHFFTSDFGGNPMMYINLIWTWGHPEVYILILPAFGIFSEVVSNFSQKRLFGYRSMVYATIAIMFLSFIVWAHHFFTMGAGANVNAFFGIMTMVIAIPAGVKIFNWLFTMYRGRIDFRTPMLWFMGFVFTFTLGGMSGILLSLPAVDFQINNSLFLVAHFHNTIIGGVVFGYFAGISYWFPKIFGFKLDERLGTYAFWCWITGFFTAFMPLYALGIMGATRRMSHYSDPSWQPFFIVAGIGLVIILVGVFIQFVQIAWSIYKRHELRTPTGDAWYGRSLEWMTASPPPVYNFAIIPHVHGHDPLWARKQYPHPSIPLYTNIELPRNSSVGIVLAACSLALGFTLVWHMWILAALSVMGIIGAVIARSFVTHTEYILSAHEVARIEARSNAL
ncbi:cytochrome o ubiquinol oxidase subunit I [bacterium]|nr:cytochrome o ubiquinol oxidase subunit I [bacterium]